MVSYTSGSPEFRHKVAGTKLKTQVYYGEVAAGHILLADRHDKVYFKNIKIRRL